MSKLLRSRSRFERVGMGLRDSTSTPSQQREIGQVAVGRQAECSGRWLCSARACDRNRQGLRRNLKLQDPIVGNTRRDGGEDSKPTIALIRGWRVRCRREQGAGSRCRYRSSQSINDGGRDGLGSPSQSVKSDSQRRARACAAGPFDVGRLVLARNQELWGRGERAVERAEMGMDKRAWAAALVNHSFKQPRTMDLASRRAGG